ncbi:alpha/beta hydrolase fold protein [Richelia sinica FACHB-800]|uniref:Alpha/beta hydrolase fold protein n=2 Tax=Richelia TaxID=98443 RepID=A0A975TBD4_9NOST|nr:alpha/beta hydrolase fold protein [Richelia sinica FACHB-800]
MVDSTYNPPTFLRNGIAMTVYATLWGRRYWESTTPDGEPPYHKVVFNGGQNVPIFGWLAIPKNAHSTIIATYGVTGELADQWFLHLLGRKAYAQGFAVVLFDWRGHGKTAELSPAMSSDGLYEGEDFVKIAAGAVAMGCPSKCWLAGYSLGGQLVLWGIKASEDLEVRNVEIAGGAVICPNIDSMRSLNYLVSYPFGRYLESRITQKIQQQAWKIHQLHPGVLNPEAIKRVNSIWNSDKELIIESLGFSSVAEYYEAVNALNLLPNLSKPTLIIYDIDDPFFDPSIIPDLKAAAAQNSTIDLMLTRYGGHVGHISSKKCQYHHQDNDPWWAWNRVLNWIQTQQDKSFNKIYFIK